MYPGWGVLYCCKYTKNVSLTVTLKRRTGLILPAPGFFGVIVNVVLPSSAVGPGLNQTWVIIGYLAVASFLIVAEMDRSQYPKPEGE